MGNEEVAKRSSLPRAPAMTGEAPVLREGERDTSRSYWLWAALLVLYLAWAFVFSIIQPLGRCPDEPAHVQYVQFLAENLRLPIFQTQGGGEAGYESQHPPLLYAVVAPVWRLSAGLEERWRWHVLRWATILVLGVPLFFVSRRFFLDWLPGVWLPWAATATVMLMPLTLLYTCHPNPDGMAMLWAATALWLACRAAWQPGDARSAALLGFVCGLGALSKLSAAPVLVVALWAVRGGSRGPAEGGSRIGIRSHGLIVLGVFLLTCGWWYARNAWLYGQAFVHAEGRYGTGLQNGLATNLWHFAKLTWRETYLSTWAQRGWFPEGFWAATLYGVVIAVNVLAAAGLAKGRIQRHLDGDADNATPQGRDIRATLNLSGLLVLLVFVGHQWAYWTVDVEFNAGGRYMLVAMTGIALLLVAGVARLGRRVGTGALITWVVALLAMNVASAWNILRVLNPRYAPGWEIFHFPVG